MLIDWTHWFLSTPYDELLRIATPLLLFDGVRYSLGAAIMFLCDFIRDLWRALWGAEEPQQYNHCPTICVVVAGLNEADTIGHTLESMWGTYPYMEAIIVDDGSNDGMADVAQQFADRHDNVTVLSRPRRGGKSSALNFALPFTQAELIVCVDGDSHLAENALWEVAQPFADPQVGAVSANVGARNPFSSLASWLQAFEYLQNIFIGRQVSSRTDTLGIISGAFGAYRRDALERMHGWDVGPGEDGDLTLRLRKSGYRIVFAPYAQCYTNVPEKWSVLSRQRRRWEWAVVTLECRKHIDLANPFAKHFRWSNLVMLAERWLYNIILPYVSWIYLVWMTCHVHEDLWKLYFFYFLIYMMLQTFQASLFIYYSNDRWRDFKIGLVAPLTPFYQLYMRIVTWIAVTEEMFSRRSFRDNFVPKHVRDATWHW